MKVILEQTVQKLGKAGQVVSVADGFARNFLFPKGLARMADKSGLARLERQEEKVQADIDKGRDAAVKTAEKLQGMTLRVVGQTAKGNTKLFGAITSTDIVDALKKESGIDVDKRAVALLHPIKRLGVYDVMVDLHRDADATVKVEVANEDGWLGVDEPEAPPVVEEEEEETTEGATAEAQEESAPTEAAPEEAASAEEPVTEEAPEA
jgi:large subunit ribosomal protein L9